MAQLLAQHTAAGNCKTMLQHQPCLLLHNCGVVCLSDNPTSPARQLLQNSAGKQAACHDLLQPKTHTIMPMCISRPRPTSLHASTGLRSSLAWVAGGVVLSCRSEFKGCALTAASAIYPIARATARCLT